MTRFPDELLLTPSSRWPTRLPEPTEKCILEAPVPSLRPQPIAAAPWASILIVTFNQIVYTRFCLETLLAQNTECSLEVIVVDNGSSDGTPDYLRLLARRNPCLRLIGNSSNRGFAPACNQALASAKGQVLIFLNNDTLTAPGWLSSVLAHLENPRIGLVGPVTNRTGNEAQIDVSYATFGEFLSFASERRRTHAGQRFDIGMVAMFCAAMRREVFDQVGALDERFKVGLFEDDDYAMRVRALGYQIVCAEDVFIHHFGQASIGNLAAQGEYGTLFHANRSRWEEKWHQPWKPYQRRRSSPYRQLTERVRQFVRAHTPDDAFLLVVSKGDEELLRHERRRAGHFPQNRQGVYAGHHPADSGEAIEELARLRAAGAQYLLFPRTAFWWLDYYDQFARHLDSTARRIGADDVCIIYDLRQASAAGANER